MSSGYFFFCGEIQYVSTAKTPITTFGERSGQGGSYSAVIGKALYANGNNQTAIGKYNEADNSNKYALIIGNGSSYSSRSNALSVDWYLVKSKKFEQIKNPTVKKLQDGDIIVYKRDDGGGHICMYVGGKIKHASLKKWYDRTTDTAKSALSTKGRRWIKVYRAK